MLKKSTLNVPFELIEYVQPRGLVMALGVYLFLKASCDGHIKVTRPLMLEIMMALGIKSSKSFNKYVTQLQRLNWIGIDSVNAVFYIRSFRSLTEKYGFKKAAAVVFNCHSDAQNIKYFVMAAIIGEKIRHMAFGRKAAIIKFGGRSALKKQNALQELASDRKISPYVGLSTTKIAALLFISRSQADRCKKKIAELEYLKFVPRYNVLHISSEPDYHIFSYLPHNRRYSIRKIKKKGTVKYAFAERVHDEVINCISFKRRRWTGKGLVR